MFLFALESGKHPSPQPQVKETIDESVPLQGFVGSCLPRRNCEPAERDGQTSVLCKSASILLLTIHYSSLHPPFISILLSPPYFSSSAPISYLSKNTASFCLTATHRISLSSTNTWQFHLTFLFFLDSTRSVCFSQPLVALSFFKIESIVRYRIQYYTWLILCMDFFCLCVWRAFLNSRHNARLTSGHWSLPTGIRSLPGFKKSNNECFHKHQTIEALPSCHVPPCHSHLPLRSGCHANRLQPRLGPNTASSLAAVVTWGYFKYSLLSLPSTLSHSHHQYHPPSLVLPPLSVQ